MLLYPHAKINIGLDIVGKRPDGYHLLQTVMMPTDWEDLLELTPATDGLTRLECTGRPVDCSTETNLVMRAYNRLAAEVGSLPPTHIRLHKNIPDGAGLGGGSADAAFALRGLNELYSLGLDDEKLADLAAELGSDCPFFIFDEPMLCTGTGTEMAPITLPVELKALTLAIVKPDCRVSTAEAYRGVKVSEPETPLSERVRRSVDDWQGSVTNAFEDTVIPLYPEIGEAKATLEELGAIYTSMSGSGSAVYGLFPKIDPMIMADMIAKQLPYCAVHVCKKFERFPKLKR
ncbi:MAG: 4-(cytidine 5'-diphospho)-2-C-methyl-D-erythritol kinase [Bacteroides sp.]|nr:4-(cytidine 5'-diphospho)-2-C-methyl-D-erythritol kinase [Bacteroides sp.]MCM1379416.1 4-(cytidine 5'-diphospho)-2-C-methyl-D-erythritol kinase [Bacteroides sp.]MCM1445276.1 4-(cytidine 5'-diphospho)-2-C-methyl-D-erythritol kinase [Prevotella sp.]